MNLTALRGVLVAVLFVGALARAEGWDALGLPRVVAEARQQNVAYLALESGGIAVVDVSDPAAPKRLTTLAEGRVVAKLWVEDGTLFAVELRQEIVTYSLAAPERPTVSFTLPGAQTQRMEPTVKAEVTAPPVLQAKVLDVANGRVIFDRGVDAGFAPGKHVRVLSQRLVEKPDLSGSGTRLVPSNEVGAVLRIEAAEAQRAMALLGRGDVAAPGDLVELSDEPLSERLLVPRRAPFSLRTGFLARPFLGLDTGTGQGAWSKPFGIVFDAYAAYYFDRYPIAIELAVAPMGLAAGTVDRHYPTTFLLTAAYATDYFEIGLGAGGLLGARGPCFALSPGGATGCEENNGFTVNQTLRLGALDGLNLRWQSSIFSRPDRFVFGVGRGEVNLPLTSRLGLFGGGGGGENGWAFGEFGVRNYLGGTGASGTLILSASLGYASIFDGPLNERVGGPSVAFGMEWRR